MSTWLVFAPQRSDDEALTSSAWVAEQTMARLSHRPPLVLQGAQAVRSELAAALQAQNALEGVAFFGHGGPDRLFDANRSPTDPNGPAALDTDNVALCAGRWVYAFACWSGQQLAARAVYQGVSLYVGYRVPLEVGWTVPPPASPEFVDLVSCITAALLAGERDERTLRAKASAAADRFIEALNQIPEADLPPGWMWLHKLAQDLVDQLAVVASVNPPSRSSTRPT